MIVPSGSDNTLIDTVFLSVLDGLKRRLGEHGLDLAIFLESGSDDRFGPVRRAHERGCADALIIADTEGVDPRVDYLGKLRETVRRVRANADAPRATRGSMPISRRRSRARSNASSRSGTGGSGWRCQTFAETILIWSRPATGVQCKRAAYS